MRTREPAWDKKQYLEWTSKRSEEPADWDRSSCLKADEHVKETALTEFSAQLKTMNMPTTLRNFCYDMARFNFGSGEVDDLLTKLNCYPDYQIIWKE